MTEKIIAVIGKKHMSVYLYTERMDFIDWWKQPNPKFGAWRISMRLFTPMEYTECTQYRDHIYVKIMRGNLGETIGFNVNEVYEIVGNQIVKKEVLRAKKD